MELMAAFGGDKRMHAAAEIASKRQRPTVSTRHCLIGDGYMARAERQTAADSLHWVNPASVFAGFRRLGRLSWLWRCWGHGGGAGCGRGGAAPGPTPRSAVELRLGGGEQRLLWSHPPSHRRAAGAQPREGVQPPESIPGWPKFGSNRTGRCPLPVLGRYCRPLDLWMSASKKEFDSRAG